jgi:hypothetical protein
MCTAAPHRKTGWIDHPEIRNRDGNAPRHNVGALAARQSRLAPEAKATGLR